MGWNKWWIARTGDDSRKDTEIWAPPKYLSNFGRIIGTSLIICEISLFLTWSGDYILISGCINNQNLQ